MDGPLHCGIQNYTQCALLYIAHTCRKFTYCTVHSVRTTYCSSSMSMMVVCFSELFRFLFYSSCGRAIKEQCKTPVSPVAWLLKQYSAPMRKAQQMEGKNVKRWRPSGVIILERLEKPYSKTQAATCSRKESEKEIENENETWDERDRKGEEYQGLFFENSRTDASLPHAYTVVEEV